MGGGDMAGLAETQGAATGGETGGLAAPNMIGDLLYGTRSVSFSYIRAASFINVRGTGSTSIQNPAIADDNSPIPLDRISFRYNYYHNAESVTGFGTAVPVPGQADTAFPVTKNYDVHQYTLSLEKTLFEGHWASIEVRLPFFTTLASNLNLSAGNFTGFVPPINPLPPGATAPTFNVVSTPGNTLGREDTEIGNLSVILKAAMYRGCHLTVSGGVGVTIPTGQDANVTVTDFGGPPNNFPNTERVRNFNISNDIYAVSPFLAALYTGCDGCFFVQGFAQYEYPVTPSIVTYDDVLVQPPGGHYAIPNPPFTPALLATGQFQQVPFEVRETIREQPLWHFDLGTGFWLVKRPDGLLTGLAPTAEVHYTTTTRDAGLLVLPGDFTTVINQANPGGPQIPAQRPVVGNQRGRLDIFDLTLGATAVFGQSATLAAGVTLPLSQGDNRIFDWEFQLQFNYYFGYCPKTACAWNAFSND
jgi:hypothetical protein